jgi:hypothetical protein
MRWVLLALAATGCAANFAESLDLDPDAGDVNAKLGSSHGVEGEQLEYEMRVAGLTVGRVQIAVGNRGVIDGRSAVIVRSRATLAGAGTLLGEIDWELTTTIDIESGFAIEQTENVTIDAPWRDGRQESKKKWSIDERHHNAHSAAGVLRGWFTAPGANDGVDVALFESLVPVTIADAARENVGDRPTVRYDGMLRSKFAFSVWITDDTSRVPVRLRAGSKLGNVEVDLVDYSAPGE